MTTRDDPPDRPLHPPASSDRPSRSTADEPTASWSDLLTGTNGVRALTLAGGVGLHAINVYIGTTIMPSVVGDIGGLDLYAWNTTIFVVASIIGSVYAAKLLQHTGPRLAYMIAAATFTLGALGCAVAPSMPILLIGRFVQGLGGGFLFSLAYAMIRVVFPQTLWPRAIALISGMWGVATLVGPAVGGTFAELGIWRAAFWSLAPITLLFALLATLVLPRRSPEHDEQSAVPLLQLSLLVTVSLAISAGSASPELIWNVAGIAVAAVLLIALIVVERQATKRLLPEGSFHASTMLAALYGMMSLLSVTVVSTEVFVPLFLQVLHGQSPLAAGYLAVLMGIGWTVGSLGSSGATGDRSRRAMLAGPVLQLVGMAVLLVLMPRGGTGFSISLGLMCVAMVMIGLGVGVAWPHVLAGILKAARPGEQDLAGASITTVQLFVAALGAALAGMLANIGGLVEPGGIEGTAGAARWLFGIFLLGPVMCLFSARRAARG